MVSSYDAQNLPTRRASDLSLRQNGTGFEAVMTHYRGIRLASGSDFDDDTGRLKAGLAPDKYVLLLSEEDSRALAERLPAAPWRVANINERVSKRSPAPRSEERRVGKQ